MDPGFVITERDLEEEPTAEVVVAGIPFQRTVYSNAAEDNVIAIYVDRDSTRAHEWLFHQEALRLHRPFEVVRRYCLAFLEIRRLRLVDY